MSRIRRRNLDSVAIGRYAGDESTTENTVSVGRKAGYLEQAQYAIAIGDAAGEETQGLNAIAIGIQAGRTSQGANAIAIGSKAGSKNQPDSSIIISTSNSEIIAVKKGLYIDPIRKFDDREGRPGTVKEGNILSYNYKNDTSEATKEVVTGFPRLPGYPTDAEVASAITLTAEDAGTMYFDTTKKKVKIYNGTKWVALADEDDLKKLKEELMAATAATASATSSGGGAYVAGSEGNVPTIGGGSSTQYFNPDGTPARDGTDFYWQPREGTTGYDPVFYRDLTVVETVRTKTDGVTPLDRDDRPGAITTIYNNGHRSMVPIPIETWNPPAAAWNALPQDERKAVINEYATANNIGVMISNPGGDGDSEANNTFTGDAFRAFLESKL